MATAAPSEASDSEGDYARHACATTPAGTCRVTMVKGTSGAITSTPKIRCPRRPG